jgi:hypothetical protein
LAVANYVDEHGCFPPPYVNGPDGRPWHSWRVLLLPYLEERATYDAYNFAEPWDGPNNRKLAERMPRLYSFHGFERPGNTTTNYLAVVGDETVWAATKKVASEDVTDGHGETILIVENRGAGVHWMEPRDLALAEMDFRLDGPKGVSSPYDDPAAVMIDGGLKRLKPDFKPHVLRALFTIRGGEPLADDGSGGFELLEDGRRREFRKQASTQQAGW